jgi:hypothetical protein
MPGRIPINVQVDPALFTNNTRKNWMLGRFALTPEEVFRGGNLPAENMPATMPRIDSTAIHAELSNAYPIVVRRGSVRDEATSSPEATPYTPAALPAIDSNLALQIPRGIASPDTRPATSSAQPASYNALLHSNTSAVDPSRPYGHKHAQRKEPDQ